MRYTFMTDKFHGNVIAEHRSITSSTKSPFMEYKKLYLPTIQLWPIRASRSLPADVIEDGERLFSRTIDSLSGTFAINELLPVADTVQLPPADAFPTSLRYPRDLFDPKGNFVREQNRGREGETFVTAFWGVACP